jgi:hypothetical protein
MIEIIHKNTKIYDIFIYSGNMNTPQTTYINNDERNYLEI